MLAARAEEGFPVPVLDDAPGLPARLEWAYRSFKDLRTCRPVGMAGAGQIPVTSMLTYFDAMGLPRSMWPEARAYWSALDAHELGYYHARVAAKMPSFSGSGK